MKEQTIRRITLEQGDIESALSERLGRPVSIHDVYLKVSAWDDKDFPNSECYRIAHLYFSIDEINWLSDTALWGDLLADTLKDTPWTSGSRWLALQRLFDFNAKDLLLTASWEEGRP